MEVGFVSADISDAQRPELEEVLGGLVTAAHPTAAKAGRWPGDVDRVTVLRRLQGARSGAEVFDISVEFKKDGRPERCVVKVDSATAVKTEWTAVRTHVQGRAQTVLTPVEAISAAVLDEALRGPAPVDRAAIVYRHAADWAGVPTELPRTLEEVVGSALDRRESGPAVRLLEGLLRRLGNALHQPLDVIASPRAQAYLNPALGPDLVLEVDRIHPDGYPTFGIPLPGELVGMRRFPMDVLHAATRPPMRREAAAGISIDDRVFLDLRLSLNASGRIIGRAEDTTIEVQPTTSELRAALADFVGRRTAVVGRVKTIRAAAQWRKITAFLPAIDDGERLTIDGISVGNPFVPLRKILTADVAGRVRATVHGDLNPRNVLVIDDQVFLIDFAHVMADRPVLEDSAWLEVCLLRDVVAARLEWPALVRLQRLLAAATRLGPVVADVGDLGFAATENPLLRVAFDMLWAIRRLACGAYPVGSRARFGGYYLEQLLLAAFRTLKWPDDHQDVRKINAVVAASGVAAEWLDGQEPYRNWTESELYRLVCGAGSRLEAVPGSVDLVAEALCTLDRYGEAPQQIADVVDAMRARVLATEYQSAAQTVLDEPAGPPYIDVEAYIQTQRSGVRGVRGSALSLIAGRSEVMVVSDAGGGKTALVQQMRMRLAKAVRAASRDGAAIAGVPARFPVVVTAGDMALALPEISTDYRPSQVLAEVSHHLPVQESHLLIGAVHLLVDAFDALADTDRQRLAGWIRRLRLQYPRTPVAVCDRKLRLTPDLLPFPVVELQGLTDEMARHYVTTVLGETSGSTARTDRLFDLLRRPRYQKIRELVSNPQVLELLVRNYAQPNSDDGTLPADIGALFGQLAGRLLESVRTDFDAALLEGALETLGVALVERNATEMRSDDVGRLLARAVPPADAWRILETLISADLLRRESGFLRFGYHPLREYYAARFLARVDDGERLRWYALQIKWREPLLMMVGFSGRRAEQTIPLIEAAQDIDPVFAAQLLRARTGMPDNLADHFIARQLATLRTPDLGIVSWEAAARGLMELDSDPSAASLMTVADQGDVAVPARSVALAALVQRALRAKPANAGRDGPTSGLTRLLSGLMRPETPEVLLRQAVEAVGELRLTGLALMVGDLIDPANEWHVVEGAYETLRRLGTAPGEKRERAYLAASEARLNSIEAILPRTTDRARIVRLTAERLAHLERMRAAGRIDVLLRRRFSFGIAGDIFWSMWLRPSPQWAVPPDMAGAYEVLQGDYDGSELISRYVEGDDWMAVAAAHRLIEDHPARSAELLTHTSAHSSQHRLLAAAQAAGRAGGHEQRLRSLIWKVAEVVDPHRIEALTALVAALPRRSALVTAASLVQWLSERGRLDLLQGWPWFRLWTDLPFDERTCEDLLLAGADHTADDCGDASWDDPTAAALLWLNADIAGGALLDAGEVDAFRLPGDARTALLSRMPDRDSLTAVVVFLGACVKAGAGTPKVLRFACEVATLRDDMDWPVHVTSSTAYGNVEQSVLADIVSRIGFLARDAYQTGDREGAVMAYRLLSHPAPVGAHPSVERGRLAALAVLGDWPAVLAGLGNEDQIGHRIARNAVLRWLPGPFTPDGFRRYPDVARWLAARLSTKGISPALRDTLLTVKHVVERRIECYIDVGSAPGSAV